MAELATLPENRAQADARHVGGHGGHGRRPRDADRRHLASGSSRPPSSSCPGETKVAALLDVARTVVRRAERHALVAARRPVARRPLPQPPVRPALDPGPLAGGPLARRPRQTEPEEAAHAHHVRHRPHPPPRRRGPRRPGRHRRPGAALGGLLAQGARPPSASRARSARPGRARRPRPRRGRRGHRRAATRSTPAVAAHGGGGAGPGRVARGTSLATGLTDGDRRRPPRRRPRPSPRAFVLGSYRYLALKSERRHALGPRAGRAAGPGVVGRRPVTAGAERGAAIADAVTFGRDLVNTPPGHLTARDLADGPSPRAGPPASRWRSSTRTAIAGAAPRRPARREPGLDRAAPPGEAHLHAPPTRTATVALVGKGITYDSGGISLKPTDGMHVAMKMDMSRRRRRAGRHVGAARHRSPR